MRRLLVPLNWPRIALGLAAPAAIVAATGGSAMAASTVGLHHGPAASSACNVSWVGGGSQPTWTDGKNWSTGKVPGPASNVCITADGVDVLTSASIDIHSLLLGEEEGIALEGTATSPVTATIATTVNLTPDLISRIDMTDATIDAAQINDPDGTIFTDGNCALNSPDITFSDGGSLQAANGTTTVEGLSQLNNGRLTNATLFADDATVVLPGDITHLVSSSLFVGPDSEIKDQNGDNALAGLTSIDSKSTLNLYPGETLAGNVVADGAVNLNGGTTTVEGTYTQAGGTLSVSGSTTVLSAGQVTIDQGGTLSAGQSTIMGNVINDGTADASGSQIIGDYTQGADGVLDSGFGGPLAVSGQATLAGEASAVEEFPVTGNKSALITFGSLSGNFTSHSLGSRLITKANQIDVVIVPQIAVTPTTVAPGQQVTVNGESFALGDTTDILLNRPSGPLLGQASPSYGGIFSVTVTIPATAKAGTHRLIAIDSGSQAVATITVSLVPSTRRLRRTPT
jgi:hypothetical protein